VAGSGGEAAKLRAQQAFKQAVQILGVCYGPTHEGYLRVKGDYERSLRLGSG
jgi:hypothetical protein